MPQLPHLCGRLGGLMPYTDDSLFMVAVERALLDEGGAAITDDPDDLGGRTKYGITQRLLTAIGGGKIDDLTEEEAKKIYYDHFWLEYKIGEINEPDLAVKVFNFCVTAGPHAAFICLQRAMRSNGVAVKEDGVLGPITRGMLRQFLDNPKIPCAVYGMYVAYKSEIAGYYRDLDKPKYEAGWVARAYR
jgi:lysozyme family protein